MAQQTEFNALSLPQSTNFGNSLDDTSSGEEIDFTLSSSPDRHITTLPVDSTAGNIHPNINFRPAPRLGLSFILEDIDFGPPSTPAGYSTTPAPVQLATDNVVQWTLDDIDLDVDLHSAQMLPTAPMLTQAPFNTNTQHPMTSTVTSVTSRSGNSIGSGQINAMAPVLERPSGSLYIFLLLWTVA